MISASASLMNLTNAVHHPTRHRSDSLASTSARDRPLRSKASRSPATSTSAVFLRELVLAGRIRCAGSTEGTPCRGVRTRSTQRVHGDEPEWRIHVYQRLQGSAL